jgi:hypothetical protein
MGYYWAATSTDLACAGMVLRPRGVHAACKPTMAGMRHFS